MFSCSTKFDYTSVRENPTLKSDVACVYVKNEPLKVAKSFCKWRNIIDVDKNTGRVLSNALSNKKKVISLGESDKHIHEDFLKNVKAISSSNSRCRLILSNQDWCKISVKRYKGWVDNSASWD